MTETAPTAPITDADLAKGKALLAKVEAGCDCRFACECGFIEADGDLSAWLRNHAPGLFARLEAAESEVERLSGEVHECPKCGRACKQCECVETKMIGLLNETDHKDARIAELEAALVGMVQAAPKPAYQTLNAPGHAHRVAGIWDDDNGEKSGTECQWCAAWSRVREVAAEVLKGVQK